MYYTFFPDDIISLPKCLAENGEEILKEFSSQNKQNSFQQEEGLQPFQMYSSDAKVSRDSFECTEVTHDSSF